MPKLLKNFSVKKARQTQVCLSKRLILEDRLPHKISMVGGVDVSYVGTVGIGAVTVLDYESLECLEAQIVTCEVKMPYIPTLLSFREIPCEGINQKSTNPTFFWLTFKDWRILTDAGSQATLA